MFYYVQLLFMIIHIRSIYGWSDYLNTNYGNECGPYGFICDGKDRVRICEDNKPTGPAFICPRGTFCKEESTSICEEAINYIDPALTRKLRCNRNERLMNPNIPGCKGYILCVLNGNRYQYINFKCSGNTIFNTITRTCTSPNKYKCPFANVTRTSPEIYRNENQNSNRPVSIECKNYKFKVTQNETPNRVAYFCPQRPVRGQDVIWCTIFSNDFCVTLEKDTEDQYNIDGTAYRKPRM